MSAWAPWRSIFGSLHRNVPLATVELTLKRKVISLTFSITLLSNILETFADHVLPDYFQVTSPRAFFTYSKKCSRKSWCTWWTKGISTSRCPCPPRCYCSGFRCRPTPRIRSSSSSSTFSQSLSCSASRLLRWASFDTFPRKKNPEWGYMLILSSNQHICIFTARSDITSAVIVKDHGAIELFASNVLRTIYYVTYVACKQRPDSFAFW